MQFRRDGAKRSLKDRRGEIEQSARKAGLEFFLALQPQEKLGDALSIAVLNSGDIDGNILRMLPRSARLIFKRRSPTS